MISYKKYYILSTVLLLSSKGKVTLKEVSNITGMSPGYIYDFLKSFKNIIIDRDSIYIVDKSSLVIEAWLKGFNLTDIALKTGWRDLEKLCSIIFKKFGYKTYRNYRFKYRGNNRELDVLGLKEPNILLCDCKLWRRARVSQLKIAIVKQKERSILFAEALKSSNFLVGLIEGWKYAEIYPVIITVLKTSLKFYDGVAVVPLIELRGFLLEFEKYKDMLEYEFVELK
ncbi:MAG: hypothetical protein J7K23_06765 [Thermoproteales archaeon]|nr:hypothetical protein [Thermoproteales archaeon]